jgi:hypothetical protein
MADQKKTEKDPEKAADKAAEQVQERVDQAVDQGFTGTETDTTPNENYTVEGVVAGKPVPEAAADPVAARREASSSD